MEINKEFDSKVEVQYDENSISVLEGLEAVRKRPAMYIGNTGLRGLHHCVYEILDNSIDEALAGYCKNIEVYINEDNSITIIDDGRGIPCGIHPKKGISTLEVIFTTLHAGGKFGQGGYKVSGGLHGVGTSVVNALSEWTEVMVSRDGKVYRQRYVRGKVDSNVEIIRETTETGTLVIFKPDKEIFDDIVFNYNTLATRIRELAFLTKGLRIHFEDLRKNKEQINVYQYDGGIGEFVGYINRSKAVLHNDVIYVDKKVETSNVEFALQYTEEFTETVFSFANNINTQEGGVHLNAFKSGILKAINTYAKNKDMIKDESFIADDIKEGLVGIISVKLEEPEFEGQTKTKLGNSEFRPLVEQVVIDNLVIYFEENPEVAQKIVDKANFSMKLRKASKQAKELEKKKAKLGKITTKGKLADCSSRKPEECEIYVVEGDSAGGSAKQGRSRKFQAILPQKGKCMNVEKQRIEIVIDSEQLMIFANAIGTGFGEDFDITKLRYNKIIIMTDADVDGAHIRTLLITFMYRYMKELILNGHVYIAKPPLYKITKGKNERYAYSDDELVNVLSEIGGKDNSVDIQRYKGLGEMNAEQLWDTTMNPEHRTLEQLAIENDITTDETISLLMSDVVPPRREFILLNAKNAVNIDV